MVNFDFTKETVFVERMDLNDPDDWGASMSSTRFGKNAKEIYSKSISVSGSPVAEVECHYFVTNEGFDQYGYPKNMVEIPEELWKEKLPSGDKIFPGGRKMKDRILWETVDWTKYNSREIADMLGCNISTVTDYAKRHNIEWIRSPCTRPSVDWDKVKCEYDKGAKTPLDLHRIFGSSITWSSLVKHVAKWDKENQ